MFCGTSSTHFRDKTAYNFAKILPEIGLFFTRTLFARSYVFASLPPFWQEITSTNFHRAFILGLGRTLKVGPYADRFKLSYTTTLHKHNLARDDGVCVTNVERRKQIYIYICLGSKCMVEQLLDGTMSVFGKNVLVAQCLCGKISGWQNISGGPMSEAQCLVAHCWVVKCVEP